MLLNMDSNTTTISITLSSYSHFYNQQLLNKAESDLKKYGDRRGSSPPRLKASPLVNYLPCTCLLVLISYTYLQLENLNTFRSLQLGVGDTLIQSCTREKMKKSEKETRNRNNFFQTRNIISFRDILSGKSMTHLVLQQALERADSSQKGQHLKQDIWMTRLPVNIKQL